MSEKQLSRDRRHGIAMMTAVLLALLVLHLAL